MTGTPSTRADKQDILFKAGLRKLAYSLTLEEAVILQPIASYQAPL